jgi:peroxiredoxin
MKFITIALAFALQFSTSMLFAGDGFVIEGCLKGFDGKTKLIINRILPSHDADMVNEQVIYMTDGRFTLTGNVDQPMLFSIRIRPDDYTNVDPTTFENLFFFVENKHIVIHGEKGNLKYAHVTGSAVQEQQEERLNYVKNKLETDQLPNSLDMENKYDLEFARLHPDYFIGVYIYSWFVKWIPIMVPKADAKDFYQQLSDSSQTTVYGHQIKYYIDNVKVHKPLMPNDKIHNFSLPDPTGENISPKNLAGKVFLLDFWFSGCGACRIENKNYQKIYAKFQSRGFEILSVSRDKDKENWLKAIKEDQMTWSNVWDADSHVTSHLYTVTSFPTNFLVDEKGKIIARDIRSDDLESVLADLVGDNQ